MIKELDREDRAEYIFTVKAQDEAINPLFGYVTINVQPIDINDNDPYFLTEPLVASVPEHSNMGKKITVDMNILSR